MRMQGLSLETIPPIHIPFRFFLTAPWMGLIAAGVLLFGPDSALSSQWTPQLLGVTHLLTLGFMAMVMLGAMFQLVPVITGRLIPGGTVVPTLVHLFLLAGMLLLAVGFCGQLYGLFGWAGPLLLASFAVFLFPLGSLFLRGIGGGDAVFSIRFAALSLLVTVALGLLRSANYAGLLEPIMLVNITNIHLAWGLAGWTLLLVMGASYQVIPMFHVTPSYPTALARILPTTVFVSLLVLTFFAAPGVQALAVVLLCIAAMVYATFSIGLLHQRKRKIPDITARFWRLSLFSLILAALCLMVVYFGNKLLSGTALHHQLPVVTGILMIYGFATSVIMGMLQKIVPFLAYIHLQRRCMSNFNLMKSLPHMGNIIPQFLSHWQYRLHLAALLGLLLATTDGVFVKPAALLMAVDFAWLGYTLTSATGLYRATVNRIALTPVD